MKLTRGKKKLEIYGSQRGVATLLISVSIALLMAVAAVGMLRSGMLEQRIVANEMRSREAQEIAQAGLEEVIVNKNIGTPSTECDVLTSFNLPNIGSYGRYIEWCYFKDKTLFFVKSQVRSSESDVQAFVQGVVKNGSILNSSIDDVFPMFLVNGTFCAGGNGNGNGNGNCFTSSKISNENSYAKTVVANGSIDPNLNGNNYIGNSDLIPKNNYSAWGYSFSLSIENAKSMAAKDSCNPFCFYGKKTLNGGTIGSSVKPVILIVDDQKSSDCTDISGQLEVYGVVYLGPNCEQSGWGKSKIYGSIISDASINKLSGNLTYEKFDATTWNNFNNISNLGKFLVPGTWKDFE